MARSPSTYARAALPFALVALAFFGLGLLAAERPAPPEPPAAPGEASAAPSAEAAPAATASGDAVAPEPKIIFDPASIQLLPDASLELDLPPGFDGGVDGGAGSADGAGPR